MPKEDFRTRLGREGLNSLLRDPRYFNADDPEHKQVVGMVARAFELVFDETPVNRRQRGRPEPDAFTRTLEQRVGDEAGLDRLPRDERAGLGRELLVRALKDDGVKLPGDVPERQPPPPGPLARLGAPTDAQRRTASARPPTERPATRRLVSTLLSDGERPDTTNADPKGDQLVQGITNPMPPDPNPLARARPKPRHMMLPPSHDENGLLRGRFIDFIGRDEVEGFLPYTYGDADLSQPRRRVTDKTGALGNRTIGYGFNLDQPGAKMMVEAAGLNFSNLRSGKVEIDEDDATALAMQVADMRARSLVNRFENDLHKLDLDQWVVLLSLAYNSPKLIGPGITQAVREQDMKSAVWEIVCNSGGPENRRALEAAMFSGVSVSAIKRNKDCSKGRPTPLR